MWGVGENCVAAMKFEISGFTTPGPGFYTLFLLRWAPGPLSFFSGGFAIPGRASLGKILPLNPENPTTPLDKQKDYTFLFSSVYTMIYLTIALTSFVYHISQY